MPAPTTIAVPCWSSWNTGIFIFSRRRVSISKHSGALMSSRLMPPNDGSSAETTSQKRSTSVVSTSISIELMLANFLNRTDLPSMTGFDARGPIAPRPRTAVPFVITATILPRAVSSAALLGSSAISVHAYATPGLYASAKSRCVAIGLVGAISNFPAGSAR